MPEARPEQAENLMGLFLSAGFWKRFAKWVLSTRDLKMRHIVMDASWMIHIPKMFIWSAALHPSALLAC